MTKVKLQKVNVAEKFQEQLDNLNVEYNKVSNDLILTDINKKVSVRINGLQNKTIVQFNAIDLKEHNALSRGSLCVPFTDFDSIKFVVFNYTMVINFYGENSLHITVPRKNFIENFEK